MRVILLFLISFSCFAQFTSDSVRKIDIIRPASTTAIIASGTLKIQDGTEGTTAHVLYSSGTEGEITWAALPSSTALVSETLVDGRIAFGSTTNVISSTSELVYNYLDNILEVSGTVTAAHLNASSTVTAITYYGDGSNLTGIAGGGGGTFEDTVVGTGGDETDLSTAVTNATAGDMLSLLGENFTEVGLDFNKRLRVRGQGYDTMITGDITLSADNCYFGSLVVSGTITLTGDNCILPFGWVTGGIIDNGLNNYIGAWIEL